MNSHEVDYNIFGDDLQAVEVELDPQETVVAEAGAMNWMKTALPSRPGWVMVLSPIAVFLEIY